jgi:hypothetical protein
LGNKFPHHLVAEYLNQRPPNQERKQNNNKQSKKNETLEMKEEGKHAFEDIRCTTSDLGNMEK